VTGTTRRYRVPVLAAPLDLVPADWTAIVLSHNPANPTTGGIWRVDRGGGTAILKLSTPPDPDGGHPWPASDEPGHWNYWKREALAYRTGFATRAYAAGGIRAPRLLDAVERPDGSIALWLEDVAGVPGPETTPDQLADFARRLGVAHRAWLDRPPAQEWLSRDWLRGYTTWRPCPEPIPWDHPIAAQAWPATLRDDLRTLWARRYDLLAAADRLPRTLCHHDVWPMNLVVAPDGRVLFDWSFVGTGAIAEDAANLALDTFFDGLVEIELLDEVVTGVVAGYSEGLGADAAEAIALTGAAKYFWLVPRMLQQLAGPGKMAYDSRDARAIFAGRRPILELLTRWARAVL
jgi:Ser/Thr protein kinase RdoA (MazF antagonist)